MLKKALLTIFLVVLVFAVVGCNVTGGSNNPDSQIPDDSGDKPLIPDDGEPILPDDEPNFPDIPGGEKPLPDNPGGELPSEPEEPENPSDPSLPQAPQEGTLFYHVNELAENVDETPEFEIREDNTTLLSNRPKLSGMAENTTEKDITDPANNENYAEYISSDRYFWGMEHTNIKNANNYIDYVKSVKDEVISAVTMLNTWVIDTSINYRYRISYDQATDTVYLEMITESNLYIKITSTYVNGKMVIDAYQYQPYDQNSGAEISCHYEEDKVLYYYEYGNFAYANLFMLTADLSQENPVNVCLSYVTADQGDRVGYQMFKYLYRMGTEDESALDVYNTYLIDDFAWEFNNFSDTIIINNSNDDYVFSAQYSEEAHSYFFSIDMYELEDYDSIIRGDSQYKIVVGENTFTSANSNEHGSENSIVYDTEDFSVMAYLFEYGTVRLQINVELKDYQATESQVLTEFLEYMGLSFKDKGIYDKLDLLDNSSEILEQYTYFDYSYINYVSPAEMDQIYAINKWTSVTYSEIMDMLSAPAVDIHEQEEDEEYYALYAGAVSGKVTLNEDNTLNLSGVTITIGDSGILTSGSEYALVAYLSNGFETYLLDRSVVTFSGVPISISLNESATLPEDLGIGKYRVVVYLVTIIEGAEVRVSSIYTLEGEGAFDKITSSTIEGNSYIIRVISGIDGLVVAKDYTFELVGQATFHEETNYLDLGGISGRLSNGYVLIPTDYVCLSGIFYGESDNPIYAIEDAFYFGSSGLSALISLEEYPVLNAGTYKLKINFSVVTEGEEIIFSADYKHENTFSATIVDNQSKDVDVIIITANEDYIEFDYSKVINVNLDVTYNDNVIDTSASTLEILYPAFFEDFDQVFLDISFISDDESSNFAFSAYATYSLLEDEFVFPTADLTNYSIEGGVYKVSYRIIISNQNGETKFDKEYTTDYEFEIISTITEGVE